MPILTLSKKKDLLTVTGMNENTYRGDIFRGWGAAAFSVDRPLLEDRPLRLDAVALSLRDGLNELGLTRKFAAEITRAFFDRWAEAVSIAEHTGRTTVFVVAEVDRRSSPWICAAGPHNQLHKFVRSLPRPQRVLFIEMLDLIEGLRKRGTAAGIDMSANFFVPPDHAFLAEVKRDWERWRAESTADGIIGARPAPMGRKAVEAALH
jgi:hypothetical protein